MRRRRGFLAAALVAAPLLAIVPMAVLAVPESLRLPAPADQDEPPATFSHWTHADYGCYACHPSIFPKARFTFTHDEMEKGLYCGSCHDGNEAWSVEDADCDTCHLE